MMSRILVAYATKTGCTQGIAEAIGKTLTSNGFNVDVTSVKDKPSPAGYDGVIVGSGARIGSWHGMAKKWVSANADTLKGMPVAFFTACLTLANEPEKTDEVQAYTDDLIAESGVQPVSYGLFAGWFEPDKFSFVGRKVLEKMDSPKGDFRDWEAVEAWTRETAGQLAP